MKEIVGKTKVQENSFPRNLTIGDTKITEKSLIAKNLNDFFVNIDRPETCVRYSKQYKNVSNLFLPEINTVLNRTELTEKEFVDAFQS